MPNVDPILTLTLALFGVPFLVLLAGITFGTAPRERRKD